MLILRSFKRKDGVRIGVLGPLSDPLALRLPEGGQPLPQERGPDHAVSSSIPAHRLLGTSSTYMTRPRSD